MTTINITPPNAGTRSIELADGIYLAHRHNTMDGHGTGTITLERLIDGKMVARATYDGTARAMQIETPSGPAPREVVEKLLDLADEGLA